jgi:WD40 repeat protein
MVDGVAMLSGVSPGGDVRAMQQLLAAHRMAPDATEAGLFDALTFSGGARKIVATPAEVSSVAVSPDGRRIVSGSTDDTVRVWDANTERQTGSVTDSFGATSVALSPDLMVSGWDPNGVRLWPGPAAWAELVCDKLTADMTRQQWSDWISTEADYVKQCPDLPVPA